MEYVNPGLFLLNWRCLWELERECQIGRWIYELKYLAWIYKFVLHLQIGITKMVSLDDI